jgi:uncharacterized protein YacL
MSDKELTLEQKNNIQNLLIVCIVLIAISFGLAYGTNKEKGIMKFLGFQGKVFNTKSILVGLVSGVIFGFIDNAGLYYGMDSLDPILPGDNLEKAGWGNTFSDFLGVFLGTFISVYIKNVSGIDNTPLFTDVIGILIGCVLGIYIPKMLK